jgi:hypothetical protein
MRKLQNITEIKFKIGMGIIERLLLSMLMNWNPYSKLSTNSTQSLSKLLQTFFFVQKCKTQFSNSYGIESP